MTRVERERERVRGGRVNSSEMNLAVPEACVVQDLLTLQTVPVHVKFNGTAAFNRRIEALEICVPRNTGCREARIIIIFFSINPVSARMSNLPRALSHDLVCTSCRILA